MPADWPPAGPLEQAAQLHGQGRLAEAEAVLRRLLADCGAAEALQRLALMVPAEQGVALAAAMLLEPSIRNRNNYGIVLTKAGRPEQAIPLLRQVVDQVPGYPFARLSLAEALERAGQADAAAAVLGGLGPMIDPLRVAGQGALAAALCDRLLAADSADLGLRLARCMARLPAVCASAGQAEAARRQYGRELADLARAVDAAPPEARARAAGRVGLASPFFLGYLGGADVEPQRTYGTLVHKIMAAAIPPPTSTPPITDGRRRIGFAGACFSLHSVSKLFAGWLRHLDRARFAVFAYDLAEGPPDAWARRQFETCDAVRAGPRPTADWAQTIAGDGLHALIYPEIGMAPEAVRLAALRLAPVQCVGWGHPVTTGLPEIDYFLSSDLMEPADGQDHYSERLVRLPGLGIVYEPPPAAEAAVSREELGLAAGRPVFLCVQSLCKYQPADDGVLAAIAAQVPEAQFLFIAHPAPARTEPLRQRLEAALAAAGLAGGDRLVFARPVPDAAFPALLAQGDVYLDSLGWSGGNTTLEAAVAGLPVVTWPGPLDARPPQRRHPDPSGGDRDHRRQPRRLRGAGGAAGPRAGLAGRHRRPHAGRRAPPVRRPGAATGARGVPGAGLPIFPVNRGSHENARRPALVTWPQIDLLRCSLDESSRRD